MRVLHVIPAVAPRYGGPSSSIVEMCRAVAGQHVQTVLATTDADGPGRLPVPIGQPVSWRGVEAIFFRRQWSEAFKYSRPLSAWLNGHVHQFSVVHIHAVLSHASLAAAAACRRAGVPYVVRPLGTLDPWSLRQKPLRKQLLLSIAARRSLRNAAAIHYTSDEERRSAERALGLSGGVVVPLGVDQHLLDEPAAERAAQAAPPYVLSLSRLHAVKNLEALIDAFAAVSTSAPEWQLVIAGTGDSGYTATLEQAAGRHSLGDRISFAGWVDGPAKRDLIRRASVFALPSHHENFGVSLVEALAAGVPAVVSRSVHLAAAVERAAAGWIVGTDAASIQEGLARALHDAADREARALNARRFARGFAWPTVACELVGLYERVAACAAPLAAVGLTA